MKHCLPKVKSLISNLSSLISIKSRIVILSAFATPFRSGAEACAEEVSALLQDDYDITIVTAKLKWNLPYRSRLVHPDDGGVKVMRVGLGLPIDKWIYPLLAPFVAWWLKPQVLHAVLESYAGFAMVLCKYLCPSAKRILTCQSTNTAFMLKSMHLAADRITAISQVLIDRAHGFGRPDAVLIPNGVHEAVFAEARMHTPKVPGRILFVGRLEKMKGVDTLLSAIADVVKTPGPGVSTDVHLRIVGDGSQRSTLESFADNLGIKDRVTFVGRMSPDRVPKEYAAAEIFCGLSRSEALGNVFLEAQAAGCAVVATNVGGIPEIVIDGHTGLLVPPNDADSAAHALTHLLTDETLRKKFSEAAIQQAKHYDWSMIAKKYDGVYRELL